MRRPTLSAPLAAIGLLVLLAPAMAGTLDTPACKRDLGLASAGVSEAMARVKGLAKASGEEKCDAYRQNFLVVVKARAVIAGCKTGPDRDPEVVRLDGTIEDLNGAIAQSCASH